MRKLENKKTVNIFCDVCGKQLGSWRCVFEKHAVESCQEQDKKQDICSLCEYNTFDKEAQFQTILESYVQ